MSYTFKVTGYYTVKEEKEYPWPCPADPNRMYKLYTDDVLCFNEDDQKWYKQTGLGTAGHILKEDELIYHDETITLQIL